MKLLAILLFCAPAFAATCPAALEGAHSYTDRFEVKWKNTTDKRIVGAKFKSSFYDAASDAHDNYKDWTADQRLDPGQEKKLTWHNEYFGHKYRKGADITLIKVVFDDGTEWSDDGTNQCKATWSR